MLAAAERIRERSKMVCARLCLLAAGLLILGVTRSSVRGRSRRDRSGGLELSRADQVRAGRLDGEGG